MAITCEKWVVMGLLAVISTLFGFLPYILFRSLKTCNPIYIQTNTYKMMVSILACFGAGVLLSLALIHLLPHVREMFEEISTIWEIFPKHFPIAEATTLAGFGLIYFVEEVINYLLKNWSWLKNTKMCKMVQSKINQHFRKLWVKNCEFIF